MNHPLVVAVTGASGAVYASRLLEVLARLDRDVHVLVSPAGAAVIRQELGTELDLSNPDWTSLWPEHLAGLAAAGDPGATIPGHMRRRPELWQLPGGPATPERFHYHRHDDLMAPVASGSFLTSGMVIVPCSGSTLGAVVHASGTNLIHRAADVHLKEHRKLVLVPRESPLSTVQLDNLARASQVGAVVLPASPGWYHGVRSIVDLVDFIVARILDQFAIPHDLMRRWGK